MGACDASEHELFFQRDVDFCGLLSKQDLSQRIFFQGRILTQALRAKPYLSQPLFPWALLNRILPNRARGMANVGVHTRIIDQVEKKEKNPSEFVIFVVPGKPPRLLGGGSYALTVKVTQLRLLGAARESPDRWLGGWDPEL